MNDTASNAPTDTAAPARRRLGVWAREEELPERRPGDLARLVVGAIVVAACGLWAQSGGSVDGNLARLVNGLGTGLESAADALAALGTLWAVAAVALLLVLVRRPRVALAAAVAGAGAWAIATLLNDLLGTRSVQGITVRSGTGPAYPAVAVAVVTAVALAVSPHVIRPLRRLSLLVVAGVALSVLYLGAALSADAIGGLFLGLAAGAAVLFAFGAPGGRPSPAEIRGALAELGFDVTDVREADLRIPRVAVMEVTLRSGERLRVDAFGRDQRDSQLAAKLWHSAMYREPALPLFGSRLQQVEHVAYATLLADRAGVGVPELVRTGVAGPDAALLVTRSLPGRPLTALQPDELTDTLLAHLWEQVRRLHDSGIAHGDLDASRVLVDNGAVRFAELCRATVGGDGQWRDRDVAAALVSTAFLVGHERAIAAAVRALGAERVGAAIPVIQPATLPAATTHGVKHLGKALKHLRAELAEATGTEDVAPLKVKRLTLLNIGMLAGVLFALTIAISGLQNVDWASVQSEFANAIWGWAVLALILYPLVPTSWATALLGCVNTDLPFVPTVLTQLACSFLNLITPNGIGGTALQLDYLHHQDVPVASGASAMVLSTGVGGAIQMILFLGAAALTSTQVSSSNSGGSISLGAIAVGAAVIGIVLWIPKVRSKVVPAVKRAASDIWAVLRNPRKGAQLFGGDLAGNLVYPALLGLCLLAFGQSLSFTQLIVVQIGAGMLGNVAPVPGGIGVTEAALTAGLTSFGIPANAALAAVITFRTITFAIPPIFGFLTLRYLRARGYA